MKIQNVTDASFGKYGKVMTEFSFEQILKEMEHTPLPEDVVYVPSVETLEALPEAQDVSRKGFGGLPVQIGYCNGNKTSQWKQFPCKESLDGEFRHIGFHIRKITI